MKVDGYDWHELSAKRRETLDRVDKMPPDLRECVHEFGFGIVNLLVFNGVTNPKAIRMIVTAIWGGARDDSQKRNIRNTIDWLLSQSGTGVSSKTFYRLLAENNLAIVSAEPTRAMLDASLAAVSDHTLRCTKEEKHRRRLRAALRAAMRPEEFQKVKAAS